jgi:hypothetical protein
LELEVIKKFDQKYGQKLLKTKDIRQDLQLKKITEDVKEQIKDAQSCLSGNIDINQENMYSFSETNNNFVSHQEENSYVDKTYPEITYAKTEQTKLNLIPNEDKEEEVLRFNYMSNKSKKESKFKTQKYNVINFSSSEIDQKSRSKERKRKKKRNRIQSSTGMAKKFEFNSNLNSVSQKFLSGFPERELNIDIIPIREITTRINNTASRINQNRERLPLSITNVHLKVSPQKHKKLPTIQCAKYQGGCFGQKVFQKMKTLEELTMQNNTPQVYRPFYNRSPMPFKQFNPSISENFIKRPRTSIQPKRRLQRKSKRPHTSVTKSINSKVFKRVHTKGCYHRILTSKTSPYLYPNKNTKQSEMKGGVFPLETSLFSSIKDLRIQSRAQSLSVTSYSKWRNLFSFAQEYEKKKKYSRAEKYYRKLLNRTKDVRNLDAVNFITNRLASCLYQQDNMVECFAFNCLNFHKLKMKDKLVCLYNSILISRQMGNPRMEFYFMDVTILLASLMKEKHIYFLAKLQLVVFFILYNCFETANKCHQVRYFLRDQ